MRAVSEGARELVAAGHQQEALQLLHHAVPARPVCRLECLKFRV